MDAKNLVSGRWYILHLPLGKTFTAQYLIESSGRQVEWFVFPDHSRKRASELLSYLSDIEETAPPGEKELRIEEELQEELEAELEEEEE